MAGTSPQPLDTAIRKAAVLVSALDAASADALLEKMQPEQAQRVRNAVMQLRLVSAQEEDVVLEEFFRTDETGEASDSGVELEQSLAGKIAASVGGGVEVAEAPPAGCPAEPFDFLREANLASLAAHLAVENPQVIAVVVAHLAPSRAADLLQGFKPTIQVDVLRRVAELDRTDPAILGDVEQQLKELLDDELRVARNRVTGVAAVSSILEAARTDGGRLWELVSQYDPELVAWLSQSHDASAASPPQDAQEDAARRQRGRSVLPATADVRADGHDMERGVVDPTSVIRDTVRPAPAGLLFSQLADLSDADLATLITQVNVDLLLLALAGASDDLFNRFLRPLSYREARTLRRRMAKIGPLRLRDIEQAQQHVAQATEQLISAGRITQPGPHFFESA